MKPPEGYITVAEAARRWGVSERTAYRRARALPDSDRVTEEGRVYVRQEVAPERGTPSPPKGNAPPEIPTGGGEPSDTGEALREIITRQDTEIAYLRGALDKSQALQLAALGEAAAMRARVDALESQNRALLESKERPEFGDSTKVDDLPPVEGGQTGQDEAQASQPGASVPERKGWLERILGGWR